MLYDAAVLKRNKKDLHVRKHSQFAAIKILYCFSSKFDHVYKNNTFHANAELPQNSLMALVKKIDLAHCIMSVCASKNSTSRMCSDVESLIASSLTFRYHRGNEISKFESAKSITFLCVGIERIGFSKIFSVWKFIGTKIAWFIFIQLMCCVHSFARRVIFFYLILVLTDATPFDTLRRNIL